MVIRGSGGWSLHNVEPPPGVSLLAHVESLLPESGRGPLQDGGEPLPDTPPPDPTSLRWSAGSLDGVLALRGGATTGNEPLAAAAAILHALRQPPDTAGLHLVMARLADVEGPRHMDLMLSAVLDHRGLNRS